MKVIGSPQSMHKECLRLKAAGKTIGFVPTMGYLHQGHLSLAERCHKDCDVSVMSIYVNPLQFGPREDLASYPRDLSRDKKLARSAGVDYLFVPSNEQMYEKRHLTHVEVTEITEVLCGASRPGHFQGVTTVVAKLFNIVCPDIAYFGQKDAQQAVVIKKMCSDLNFGVKIKVMPIVREPDGLAMSSRNKYLSQRQRSDALVIHESLRLARGLIGGGERDSTVIIRKMKRLIRNIESATIDYVSIVDAESLSAVKKVSGRVLIAAAVFIGRVRLIDNMIITV